MAITEWQNKVRSQLDMRSGKKLLELSNRRVPVDTKSYHLIIGLGGTGCRALIETKGYIQLTCRDSEKHVAYRAFDTDRDDLDTLTSSAETGEVKLADPEKQYLDPQGVADMLAPKNIDVTLDQHPEIFEWLDGRLKVPGDGKGANHVRQAGRLLLWQNLGKVRTILTETITNLVSNNGEETEFNVYLLTGIAGGTGSGIFLDMAYLIRDVMSRIAGTVSRGKIYGYFFMPDVNNSYSSTGDMEKGDNNRNAYAALQELDYNLGLFENDETFKLTYAGGVEVTAGVHPQGLFDQTHIVSATNKKGAILDNASDRANRAIAQNILSFVSNASERRDDNGQRVNGFYGNLPNAAESAVVSSSAAHRFGAYVAIGSNQYELPIDDMMMYITKLLFDRVKDLFKNDPDTKSFAEFRKKLQFERGGVYTSAVSKVNELLMPVNLSSDQLKRQIADDSYHWINEGAVVQSTREKWMEKVVTNLHGMAADFITRFDREIEQVFRDPRKGPIYANHLIASAGGVLSTIRAERDIMGRKFGENPVSYASDESAADNVKKRAMDKLREFRKAWRKTQEAVDSCNSTGQEFYKECVWCAIAELVDVEYYKKIEDYVAAQNHSLFEFMVSMLDELNETFSQNAEELTRMNESELREDQKTGVRTFSWQPLTIRRLSDHLEEAFDRALNSRKDGINAALANFVSQLWAAAQIWMKDNNRFNPKKFVSEYIDSEFSKIAEESIEDVVKALLKQDGAAAKSLKDSVQEDLLPALISGAAPMYYGDENVPIGPQYTLISVPMSCTGIYDAIYDYCLSHPELRATLQQSTIRNRIFVQTVLSGVQLAGYQTLRNAEEDYAQKEQVQPGVHLYHPTYEYAHEKRDWNDLYTLIPRVYRPKAIGLGLHTQNIVRREDGQKSAFAALFDEANGYRGRLPMVEMDIQDNAWQVNFSLTAENVVYRDGTLSILRGPRDEVVYAETWHDKTATELKRCIDAVRALYRGGLIKQYTPEPHHSLNVAEVRDPVTKLTNNEKTFVNLQEAYLRRYMLMRAVEAEKRKYAAMRDFIKDAEQAIAGIERQEGKLLDFTYALLTGRLATLKNIDGHTEAQFVGDRGRRTFGDLGMLHEEYEANWKLYSAYSQALEDKGQMGNVMRKYRDMARDAIKAAFSRQNAEAVTGWLNAAQQHVSALDGYIDGFESSLNISGPEQEAWKFCRDWKGALENFIGIARDNMNAWGASVFIPGEPQSASNEESWDI